MPQQPALSSAIGPWAVAAVVMGSAMVGCGDAGPMDSSAGEPAEATAKASFRSSTHQPYTQLGMNTDKRDPQGRTVRVACAVCHHALEPKPENARARKLEGFHEGVVVEHAELGCQSCHQGPSYEGFHLVSGEVVEYGNVVELCAQCHGQQWRDYQHGAHGGMTGHWDLGAGPRQRNHCIDCHAPHSPKLRQQWPAPMPNYRFLGPEEGEHG